MQGCKQQTGSCKNKGVFQKWAYRLINLLSRDGGESSRMNILGTCCHPICAQNEGF